MRILIINFSTEKGINMQGGLSFLLVGLPPVSFNTILLAFFVARLVWSKLEKAYSWSDNLMGLEAEEKILGKKSNTGHWFFDFGEDESKDDVRG